MKRALVILPIVVFGLILFAAYILLVSPKPAPASFISPMRPAPQFDVPGLAGAPVKLSDFKGRPVLVNFWATWCGPCKLEHPLLVEMRTQGVEIVGMLYKDPTGHEGAKQLLANEGDPYAVVGVDDSGDLGIDMGLSGVPESFLIDAEGRIIKTKRNYFVEQDALDFIAAYKAEQAKGAGR